MEERRMQDGQEIMDWVIRSSEGSIMCKVDNYRGEKYQVRFFTYKNELIGGRGINIPEEWIKDTNPRENLIHDKLKSLLRHIEKEAKREKK